MHFDNDYLGYRGAAVEFFNVFLTEFRVPKIKQCYFTREASHELCVAGTWSSYNA